MTKRIAPSQGMRVKAPCFDPVRLDVGISSRVYPTEGLVGGLNLTQRTVARGF